MCFVIRTPPPGWKWSDEYLANYWEVDRVSVGERLIKAATEAVREPCKRIEDHILDENNICWCGMEKIVDGT